MKSNFNDDISNPEKFVITLELVPGREITGQKLGKIKGFADDACQDGRISAVSITDNPGGNPALFPDVLGSEMLAAGMDVIVHFTCRDMNRIGMESRALQLAHLGMKNILALTGDYVGVGYSGRGNPVFDFDSIVLLSMFNDLNKRFASQDDSTAPFFTGCAVSPFKYTEAETVIQYRKLQKKITSGAQFTITQLGYDIDKFEEILLYMKERSINIPIVASLYLLGKGVAKVMNAGKVPGVHVSDRLLQKVLADYETGEGKKHAIERLARLGAVLKGIGYKGIHIGGIHDSFATVATILDRIDEIQDNWQEYREEFQENLPSSYYMYAGASKSNGSPNDEPIHLPSGDGLHYSFLHMAHAWFFEKNAVMAPFYRMMSQGLDNSNMSWLLKTFFENPFKRLLLSCEECGDCAIQHIGFLCPESGCPKHSRNGACGGSMHGFCEVNKDKLCVWVRAYYRMKEHGDSDTLVQDFVPPRLWDLKGTSSWINFHLDRDHQAKKGEGSSN